MMTTETIPLNLTRQDFVSDQEVRWCPGCGDYAILAQVQKVLPDLGIPREKIVFISGIGCSSRFPYYMNTYGIHSIHGRAPTLATGLAIANPDLHVWVITGDGDGLSIGGNHMIHTLRRNVNLTIVLFNNRIYGLTKGQYSPTSRQGTRTKSSPMGSIESPLKPIALALSAEATFVARSIDVHTRHLAETLEQAARHQGVSFVEVYQNCVIFNPQEWEGWTDRKVRDDNFIYLEHGKPMKFGKNSDKGIVLDGFTPQVVALGDGVTEDQLLVHDEQSVQLAYILSSMEHPHFPTPMGVIRRVEKPTYTEALMGQVALAIEQKGAGDLNKLYRSADLWTVVQEEEAAVATKVYGGMPANLNESYLDDLDKSPDEGELDRMGTDPISMMSPRMPIAVQGDTSLAEAVALMKRHNIGCLLVTDNAGMLTGIFTERDVLKRVAGQVEELSQGRVADFMTPHPHALQAHMPIAHAVYLMSHHNFRHLPLVDGNYHPQGIISFRDVIHYLKEYFN